MCGCEMTHSPGPWQQIRSGNHKIEIQSADGAQVCVVNQMEGEEQYPNPNAALIEAAPMMLAALESIENDNRRIPRAIWAIRNAAIAKAKGK